MPEEIWVALIVQTGAVIVAMIAGGRKLNRIGADASTAATQTANDHADAEYPNLRDEVTAIHETVRGVGEIVRGHDRRFDRIERNVTDLHEADDYTESTLDRQRLATARALANAIGDLEQRFEQRVPELIELALQGHVRACPLRRPTPPSAKTP